GQNESTKSDKDKGAQRAIYPCPCRFLVIKGNLLPVWQINKEIANRNEPFGERKFFLFCLALQDTIS
ncbi:TPA: hypothetical protein ACPHNJ_002787, partial [Enterococcus faecium]